MKKNKLKELYIIATELSSDFSLLEFDNNVKINLNDPLEGESFFDSFLENRVWGPLIDSLKVEFSNNKNDFSDLTDNDWEQIFASWKLFLKSSIEPKLIKDYIMRENELNNYGSGNRFSIIETLNNFFYEAMLEPQNKWMRKERVIKYIKEAIKNQIKAMDNDILWLRHNRL